MNTKVTTPQEALDVAAAWQQWLDLEEIIFPPPEFLDAVGRLLQFHGIPDGFLNDGNPALAGADEAWMKQRLALFTLRIRELLIVRRPDAVLNAVVDGFEQGGNDLGGLDRRELHAIAFELRRCLLEDQAGQEPQPPA